jgi:hypothetical protein
MEFLAHSVSAGSRVAPLMGTQSFPGAANEMLTWCFYPCRMNLSWEIFP